MWLMVLVLGLGFIWQIGYRGYGALSWSFFTEQIRLVGAAGGIFFNLVGTLILVMVASLSALPLALGMGILVDQYLKSEKWKHRWVWVLQWMNGIPSILFGIMGMMFFVHLLGWGKSWLAGGLILGAMMFSSMSLVFLEKLQMLPSKYAEAGRALGLSHSRIIWSIVVPQSLGGLWSGLALAVARASGETAPIMFTATIFAGATLPSAIKESPVLSLPYHIFILSQDSYDPEVRGKIWGTALTLLLLVSVLSLIALPFRMKTKEESHHG